MKHKSVEEVDVWAYVSKTASETIKARVEDWIHSDKFDEELFNSISKTYKLTEENPHQDTLNVEIQKASFFDTTAKKGRKKRGVFVYTKYAAIAILFIVVSSIVYQQFAPKTIIMTTNYGEEKEVTLPDGSTVWLNAGSTISYKKDFPRTIQLNGEAFFEVAKDKAHPFTVETPDHVIVKALGTSFNVKAYPENTYLETTLLTGKVEMTSQNYFNEKVIMLPNDHIKILKTDGIPIKTTVKNKTSVLTWRKGKIRFKNMAFRDIANDLNQQLDIKLVFNNTVIAASRFTAVFDKSTSAEDILEILQDSKHFTYHLNPKTNEWIIE